MPTDSLSLHKDVLLLHRCLMTARCRGLQSLTAVDDVLYLYGGAPQKGPMLADLWALDTKTRQWKQLHPKPAANGWKPHARCSHGAAAMNGRLFFLAGSYYK